MTRKTKPLGQSLPLTEGHVEAITALLLDMANGVKSDRGLHRRPYSREHALRNLAIFRMAIDTMLRSSDLLALTTDDTINYDGTVKEYLTVRQGKTGKIVTCWLSEKTRSVVKDYFDANFVHVADIPLFPLKIRSFEYIIKDLMWMIRVDPARFTPHSLRRTKPSIIYGRTRDIEAARQLLGHSSIAATSHYLGVSQNMALDAAKSVDI